MTDMITSAWFADLGGKIEKHWPGLLFSVLLALILFVFFMYYSESSASSCSLNFRAVNQTGAGQEGWGLSLPDKACAIIEKECDKIQQCQYWQGAYWIGEWRLPK